VQTSADEGVTSRKRILLGKKRITLLLCLSQLVETYWGASLVESPHGYFEARSLSNEDVLLGYPHIFEGDASGVGAPLTHVQLLQGHMRSMCMFVCYLISLLC